MADTGVVTEGFVLCVFHAGCDDLVNAVYELAKGFNRLQLSDEEMALFSAAVLLSPGDDSKNALECALRLSYVRHVKRWKMGDFFFLY